MSEASTLAKIYNERILANIQDTRPEVIIMAIGALLGGKLPDCAAALTVMAARRWPGQWFDDQIEYAKQESADPMDAIPYNPINTEAQNDMPADATTPSTVTDEDRDLIQKWAIRIVEKANEIRDDFPSLNDKAAAISADARRIMAMLKALG